MTQASRDHSRVCTSRRLEDIKFFVVWDGTTVADEHFSFSFRGRRTRKHRPLTEGYEVQKRPYFHRYNNWDPPTWLRDLFQHRTGFDQPTSIWGTAAELWRTSVNVKVLRNSEPEQVIKVFSGLVQVCPNIQPWDAADMFPHRIEADLSVLQNMMDSLRMTAEILRS